MNLEIGVRVGPYEILARIGAGGMGEVYRARDERLGRDIALKILWMDVSTTAEQLRRFDQEARAASALNHPGIVTVYDIGRVEGMAYIAMELIEGHDLRSLLARERLPLKQALRIAVKVADALAAAHERGIVHRDLKPENVMISREGFVKILDFGLAKLVRPMTDTDTTLPHTHPGLVFGTVKYMSPEQASGRDVDYRSDQFALGVMLYEMVTGHPPFSEGTAAETMAAIIRSDPKPLSAHDGRLPVDLVRIVMRLLSKQPSDRYAATRDLALDLREVRDRNTNTSNAKSQEGLPIVRTRPTALLIAGAVMLLIAGTAALINLRGPDSAAPAVAVAESGSVAVLPFVSTSGEADGQLFADGVAEVVSARLAQSGVKVVDMFTAATAKPGSDLLAVAGGRGARKAIRGTVSRTDGALSLSFSIVETATGRVIGSQTVSGEDLPQLEPRIVESIRTSLNLPPVNAGQPPSTALMAPEDRTAYVQALGILQNVSDEKSVDRAIEMLLSVIVNARDSALVNAQLARAYLYKSQLSTRPELIEQAVLYAERAVELDASDPEVRFRLGQVRLQAGRHVEAESEFRRALALREENADATLGLAVVNEKLGRASEAERMYRKAIALRPDHAPTYNVFASFLYNGGRYEEAAENFRRYTELIPTAWGFFNLGQAYHALGRYDEAYRAHARSIAIAENAHGYKGLGNAHFYAGRHADAIAAFRSAVRLAPRDFDACLGLANALYWSSAPLEEKNEAFQKTLDAANHAIGINPRDPAAHATAALAMLRLGRREEAAAATSAALKIDPTHRSALYVAAVVALDRGAIDTAANWLESAVRSGHPPGDLLRDPEFQSIRDNPGFRKALQQKN